ncbi:MAG: hypothetical protein DRJ09_07505 [Bacteroidetes bacterium]|nr:MAG: hypothetical protein DRJ09_07505 [Bacteroidota bacterium]
MKITQTIHACEKCIFRNLLFDSLNQQEFKIELEVNVELNETVMIDDSRVEFIPLMIVLY